MECVSTLFQQHLQPPLLYTGSILCPSKQEAKHWRERGFEQNLLDGD